MSGVQMSHVSGDRYDYHQVSIEEPPVGAPARAQQGLQPDEIEGLQTIGARCSEASIIKVCAFVLLILNGFGARLYMTSGEDAQMAGRILRAGFALTALLAITNLFLNHQERLEDQEE